MFISIDNHCLLSYNLYGVEYLLYQFVYHKITYPPLSHCIAIPIPFVNKSYIIYVTTKYHKYLINTYLLHILIVN